MAYDEILLKDLIHAVSNQLIASREERLTDNRPPIFEVDELTIEASFVITKASSSIGGFDLKIIKGDAKEDYRQDMIHKIILKLKALKDYSNNGVLKELGDEVPLRPHQVDIKTE